MRAERSWLANLATEGDDRPMFQTSLSQQAPGSEGALGQAVGWLEGVLLGSVGTSIAVLALAGVGFAMLNGRISFRGGVRTVLGCFILFGAGTIANSLTGLMREQVATPEISPAMVQPAPPSPPKLPPPRANPFDPYAGASVPLQ